MGVAETMLTALLESKHQQLVSQISVKIQASEGLLFETRKSFGGGVLVVVGTAALRHPKKQEIIQRCAMSALEVLRGTTSASKVTASADTRF